MNCPKCERELIYNAILRLYYCVKEHGYYELDKKSNKLIEFKRFTF